MLKAKGSMPGNAQGARRRARAADLCALSMTAVRLGALAPGRAPSAQGGSGIAQAEPGFPQPSYDMIEPGTLATAKLPQLEDVTFKQRLNTQLPLDVPFKDENGQTVTLAKYFTGERPVILAFVYYGCPMLCTQVMNGVSSAAKALPFTAGKDFDVVFISFDPRDKPETAYAKKTALLNYWSMQNQAGAWHFLTGEVPQIKQVTSAAGFFYKWDEKTFQPSIAHMSGVLVLTPTGRLSRYFYGIERSPKRTAARALRVGAGAHRLGGRRASGCIATTTTPRTAGYGAMVMQPWHGSEAC